MKTSPPGTFTCTDPEEHTIPDALRIINREMETRGYRALPQGDFLLVVNLDGLRSGYNSPSFVRNPHPDAQSRSRRRLLAQAAPVSQRRGVRFGRNSGFGNRSGTKRRSRELPRP